jgi:hypothetical protein
MTVAASAAAPAPAHFSPKEIGERYAAHQMSVTRWITIGAKMTNGSRLRLRATRTPGSWLVTQEDLDEFLAALTADRLREKNGTPTAANKARTRAANAARIARMNAACAEAGI